MRQRLNPFKMKVSAEGCSLLFTTSFLILISGLTVHSLSHSYDYSASTECLAEPHREHYGGGIIVNPGFDHNLEGWTVFGNGAIEERRSNEGNAFIVARNRTQPLDSFSQKIQLKKGMLYTFSAWLQLSEGSDTVSVVFKINGRELIRGGHGIAKHGCWTLMKGGLVANFTSPAEILFESKNPTVEIWADSVSLQPFTKEQWRSHQEESIEREDYFDWILREGYAHPAVQGIIMFMGPVQAGFKKAPLADENFKNTPIGDVVDMLIREWGTGPHEAKADSRGIVDISLHHGDYDVIVTHPQKQFSKTLNLSVRKGSPQQTIHVKMHA